MWFKAFYLFLFIIIIIIYHFVLINVLLFNPAFIHMYMCKECGSICKLLIQMLSKTYDTRLVII